jgi:hypothetical protein
MRLCQRSCGTGIRLQNTKTFDTVESRLEPPQTGSGVAGLAEKRQIREPVVRVVVVAVVELDFDAGSAAVRAAVAQGGDQPAPKLLQSPSA